MATERRITFTIEDLTVRLKCKKCNTESLISMDTSIYPPRHCPGDTCDAIWERTGRNYEGYREILAILAAIKDNEKIPVTIEFEVREPTR